MTRVYGFTGKAFSGLFVCHLYQNGMEAILQAALCDRVVKSVSFSVLSGAFYNYPAELSLFLNRLNSFICGRENVVSIQNLEDVYHDEQLQF